MNLRCTIVLLSILYFPNIIWSQVTGKIINTSNQPVDGATIVMQLPDSTYLGQLSLRPTVHSGLNRSRKSISSLFSICFIRPSR